MLIIRIPVTSEFFSPIFFHFSKLAAKTVIGITISSETSEYIYIKTSLGFFRITQAFALLHVVRRLGEIIFSSFEKNASTLNT